MNRSKLPKMARWITTGRCSALSAPTYFRSNRCGHLVVELNRAALPLAADGVGDVEVDLRAVEGAVAGVERVGLPGRSSASLQLRLGVVPGRDLARNFSGRVDSLAVYSRPKSP